MYTDLDSILAAMGTFNIQELIELSSVPARQARQTVKHVPVEVRAAVTGIGRRSAYCHCGSQPIAALVHMLKHGLSETRDMQASKDAWAGSVEEYNCAAKDVQDRPCKHFN